MPVVDEERLKTLLAEGRISALSIDTSIFDQKRLQLNSTSMKSLLNLKARPFRFILTDTVSKEVVSHLTRAAEEALQQARRSIGKALYAFETEEPTRSDLIETISGGRTAEEAAKQRWEKFTRDTSCEILDDAALVPTSKIYDAYFHGRPPFGSGSKKNEFPDALALNALEAAAANENTCVMVVSSDGDWRAFCEQSSKLYLVKEIEKALALIANAPVGLRSAIHTWLHKDTAERGYATEQLARSLERLEFSATAHPTNGDVELFVMNAELDEVTWPDEDAIDIIGVESTDDPHGLNVVASMTIDLVVRVPVELNFSIWDSADRESISMGGRMVEKEEQLTVRALFSLYVFGLGTNDESIDFEDAEIEGRYYEVDLGQVDLFEPEDYCDDEELA